MSKNIQRAKTGFTLIEMMVVIVIIGILASIAVPAYNKYISWARSQEARVMLPQIRAKQRAYYQEFRTYINTYVSSPSMNPSSTPCGTPVTWQSQSDWQSLGVVPPSVQVNFQYWTKSGTGATRPSTSWYDTCYGLVNTSGDFPAGSDWFVVCARGSLTGSSCSSYPNRFGISGADGRGKIQTNYR